MWTIARRLAAAIGIAAALMLVAGGAALVALQTESAKLWLAGTLSRLASDTGRDIRIEGLGGTLPHDTRAARIVVSDDRGPWLIVEDAAIELVLRDLLAGRATIRRLDARAVTVARLPEAAAAPSESAPPDKALSLPELPVAVDLQSLQVDRIHVAQPVIGEPITASLAGAAQLSGRSATARFALHRTDGRPGQAELSLAAASGGTLALDARVVEPGGRVLQHALGRAEPVPFALTLAGTGPLDGWTGTLSAEAGDLAALDAELGLALGVERDRFSVRGTLALAPLLPDGLRAAVRGPVAFAAHATRAAATVTIEGVTVESAAFSARGSGRVETDTARATADATIAAPDLAAFAPLLGTAVAGAAELELRLDGPIGAPNARLAVSGRDLRIAQLLVPSLRADLDLTPGGPGWRATGGGAVHGIARAGAPLPAVPERIAWTLDATTDAGFGAATLHDLTLRGDGIELAAAGQASFAAPARADGTLRLTVGDLAALREAAGLPLAGRLRLDVEAATEQPGAVTAHIRAGAEGFESGVAALDALAGASPTLAARVQRDEAGAVRVDGLRLAGAHAALSADATLPADGSGIAARAHLDVPALAPLGAALGTALDGRAMLAAEVSGAWPAPTLTARLTASALQAGAARLDQLVADLDLKDATAPRGLLAARFEAGALSGRAAAEFARTDATTLRIPKLSLTAPGTSLEGALTVALDTSLMSGTLAGRVDDLGAWSPLVGQKLAGRGTLKANLAAARGQAADVTAAAAGIAVGTALQVKSVRIDARLTDLLGTPGGRAELDIAAAALPALSAERTRVVARAVQPGTFAVTAETHGIVSPSTTRAPFRLAVAAELRQARDAQVVRLTRAAGKLGADDIALARPLTLTRSEDSLRLEDVSLRIAGGDLSGSASRVGDRIALRLRARDIPLNLIDHMAPDQPLRGRLGLEADLAGTVHAPHGRLEMRVADLRFSGRRVDVPPLAVAVQARWQDGRADLNGRVDGPAGSVIAVEASAPLRLDPQTLVPSMPADAPIHAAARGDGRLETWQRILPLGEDRIAGRFEIDLAVDGTRAAPRAGGRLAIADGRYVNFAAGTELHGIDLELAGDGQRFVLRRLSAGDGARGTMTATGFVDLAAAPGPAFDVATQLAAFRAVRRDDATVTADGELRLSGTPESSRLAGRVRVARAEFRVPERLPPGVASLDVIEIDSRTGAVLSTPPESSPPALVALDLAVEMPGQVFVRGRGLDSEWRGLLAVRGTNAAPEIAGRLEIVRGDFALLGKSFDLSRGTIAFDGGSEIDPTLDILAVHRKAEITAQAVIAGTASAPTLTLTSAPELPQDEVLARVLFGRGVSQLTPAQGLQLAQAAASLAGGGPGILDRIRGRLGLDRLDVSAGATDPATGTNSGPTVSGGRYIREGVFVGVEQGASTDSTRTKVEVELTPNLTVESDVGANASAGVGVNWRWDY